MAPPSSQSRLAYFHLEHLVVTHALSPGLMVTEKHLIALVGLGRTPVREAIQQLAWLGLIDVRPRAGLQIAGIGAQDRDNVLTIRRKLEPEAAALAARHGDDDQRMALLTCAKEMTGSAVTGDLDAFLKAGRMFIDIIDAACPNAFLNTALGPARAHARRLWCLDASSAKMDRSVTLHVAVIRAMQQRNDIDAAKGMAALVDAF